MATNDPRPPPQEINIDDILDLNEHAQPRPADVTVERAERIEQQVQRDDLGEPDRPATPTPTPAGEGPDDRLSRALATIEELRGAVSQLQTRGVGPRQDATRTEPVIEYDEVFPGRRIPRDPSKRTIRISPEDLVRLGWNDERRGPAHVIEQLANAFFGFIQDTIPQATVGQITNRQQEQEFLAARHQLFWEEFEDLKPHQDFLKAVEATALTTGSLNPQGKTVNDYNLALGRLARERIASMRGITYDQYLSSIGKQDRRPPSSGGSRSVTTPSGRAGGGSGRPPRNENFQQRMLEDT